MYLVLQLVIGIIIENIEMLEKIENMKVTQKHLQVRVILQCAFGIRKTCFCELVK